MSVAHLSNVERNLRSPTIIDLQKICHALDIMLNDLLKQEEENFAVKKEDRKLLFVQEDKSEKVSYHTMTEVDRELACVCLTVSGTETSHNFRHKFDEIGIVVQGSMAVTMMMKTYILHEGDTMYIPANCVHSFKKTSTEDCISYWITSQKIGREINSQNPSQTVEKTL